MTHPNVIGPEAALDINPTAWPLRGADWNVPKSATEVSIPALGPSGPSPPAGPPPGPDDEPVLFRPGGGGAPPGPRPTVLLGVVGRPGDRVLPVVGPPPPLAAGP
ncbi:MAG: hypothetical protein KAJ19_20515 [Gammaproteobacteria bacterium]|nr:hypothetical protein [Gammaproteobacteria bacterium]